MAEHQPARGGLRETMAEFVNRRRREVEHFGQEAEAAARDAYGRAIRTGSDLVLKTQGQVMRHGADLVGTARPPGVRPAALTTNRQGGNWLDRSPVAKAVGGDAARLVGNAAGVARGGVHTVEGLADGAVFLGRLANPWDRLNSPPGQSAAEQLVGAGRGIVDYAQKGFADPQRVVRDVQAKAHQMRIDLDPDATPMAPTFAGEFRRNLDIGQNQGEFLVDVGSFAIGGPLAKSVKELGLLSKAASYEKSLAQGLSPSAAKHLSQPYVGKGHHSAFPQRTRLPSVLGGGPLPRSVMDSPFNRLAPPGMTRGEFYERHFRVDPHFYGAGLPRALKGESWSGRKLGLTKYGFAEQLWHGTPAPLKARIGGFAAGDGGLLYSDPNEEE